MHGTYSGRVALVTGAAQGIGHAIAAALAAGGARVHAADIDESGMAPLAALVSGIHRLDVGDRRACHAVIDAVRADAGGIDILVNAAGGVRGQVGRPIEEIAESHWREIFAANTDGAFWLAQACAPAMKAARYGRIVNIASGAGLRPSLTGIQAYCAAKHALVGITRQLSWELAPHGITVNAVAPGFVLSNPSTRRQWESYGAEAQQRFVAAIHTRRLGTAEDIANAALFFAAEASGWISGQVLSVDGGRS
jgi:NAD(P)-dependent dehydrogenase (short-subunit alcohol dehydrogenase family)